MPSLQQPIPLVLAKTGGAPVPGPTAPAGMLNQTSIAGPFANLMPPKLVPLHASLLLSP
jgi:hypothetical protein